MSPVPAVTGGAPQSVFWRPAASLRVATTPSPHRRLAVTILVAIIAFPAVLLAAGTASAAAPTGPESRVAAQTGPDAAFVGVKAPDSPVSVWGNGVYAYDGVSVSRVAPSGALDDVAEGVAGLCRTNSFVPSTEVLMADGTTKPIEDVEIGDWVWATNPETGEAGSRQVVDTIVGDGEKHLVDIRVAGDTLTATRGHPFWVDDEGHWIDAEDLTVGVRLELVDGSTVPVEAVATRVAVQRVYNLTVDGIHTYYVEVADEHVLTHNSGCLSPNQMNQAIQRGQAPRGITRIDTPKVPNEQLHATFEGGAALNVDGSWKHGFVDLTRAQRDWLIENGWDL